MTTSTDASLQGSGVTIGSAAALIAQTLRSYDQNPQPLFDSSGIDLGSVTQPETRHPRTAVYKLLRLAVEATGDPCFGLKVAEHMQPAALHGLGFAWLASDTLRDAFNRLTRYARLLSSVSNYQLENGKQTVDLVVKIPQPLPQPVPEAVDMTMAIFQRMCRITAGDTGLPLRVHLQRPVSSCNAEYGRLFGAPIQFNMPDSRLCFDQDTIGAPLPNANPELARINDQAVIDYLARFDRGSIAMQVRSRIIEHLPDGPPPQEAIAKALHVSLRSLQRKLKDEDTNFKNLLDGTRRELAMHYIREQHKPIYEITYLLGFSEPSNFTRAFKRWTGMSPADYRNSA